MLTRQEFLQNLSENVRHQVWALLPSRTVIASLLNGEAFDEARRERAGVASSAYARSTGRLAVISVNGILLQQDTGRIGQALAAANADSGISQILLNINSPGGSVYGVQELGDQIAHSKKRVVALANSLAASAAYWIGSQCSEFYCTPGGEVGSIGVYTAHADISAALEMEGTSVTLVSAGRFKTDGNPYQPLSASARQHMQRGVDGYYNSFIAAVARGRKVAPTKVRYGFGEGKVLGAKDALAAGMIDGICALPALVANMRKVVHYPGLGAARRALALLEGNGVLH